MVRTLTTRRTPLRSPEVRFDARRRRAAVKFAALIIRSAAITGERHKFVRCRTYHAISSMQIFTLGHAGECGHWSKTRDNPRRVGGTEPRRSAARSSSTAENASLRSCGYSPKWSGAFSKALIVDDSFGEFFRVTQANFLCLFR